MAIHLTSQMLSDMANTLQYLQSRVDETYKFGVSLEESFGIDLVSHASGDDQDLSWQNLWHMNILKLRSIHKIWSAGSGKVDVEIFNSLCDGAMHDITVKMNECLDMQRHCVTRAVFAPSVAAVEAADAAAASSTMAAAATIAVGSQEHVHAPTPTPTPVGAGAAADASTTPGAAAAEASMPANCEMVPTTSSVILPAIVKENHTSFIETESQIAPSLISDQPLLC